MGDTVKRPDHVMFGAAYYREYEPTDHLDEDMRLMREAHMNLIRVGESVWSRWEPEEGKFDLDWLAPVLDAAHANGIDAVIGLPTYAIPMWMARQYPDIALQSSWGVRRGFGGREEHNYNHPGFRFFAERICRKIVERYRDHPAVVGWQLHNEPGVAENDSPSAFEGFKNWLRRRYGTVERLNKAWGLVYWSHELSDWNDLWQPESNAQPQYDLEWRRYQAELTDEMLAWQSDMIADLRRGGQFITVNYALGRYALDEAKSARLLDVTGSDPYYQMQDGLAMPEPKIQGNSWAYSGASAPAMMGDRTYSLKQAPYYVLETDGGPIGEPFVNYPGFHGQWRQVGWQFVSRGAEMVEYWHWRQLHYGTETYWGAVLPHDGEPGRVYTELAQLGEDLERAGSAVIGLKPDYDVTMLYSVQSRWGLEYQPHVQSSQGGGRNPMAFDDTFRAFYDGAFASGRQVRIVQDEQLVDPDDGAMLIEPDRFARTHPVLVAAGVYVCSDAALSWMRQYVTAGGHLILGPRTAYADDLACAREQTKPAHLRDLAGASYQEFSNLVDDVPARAGAMALREGAAATRWIDCLRPEGCEILATSDHPHFGQFPLITSHVVGGGRVTVVGTMPNTALAASVIDYACPAGVWTSALAGHAAVTHSSAVNEAGTRLHFLFNWSWQPDEITLPVPCRALLDPDAEPRQTVELGAWGVAVLAEA